MKHFHLPPLIAHRGASADAPENTLIAFQKAAEMGAQWVEFDVMLTADHQPIIFHDSRLQRTTNGKGLVSRTSFQVIERLDAGSWFRDEFTGEKVPTLYEVLALCGELGLGVNIEMKGNARSAKLLAQHVVAALAQTWRKSYPQPLISSLSKTCLKAIYERAPDLLLGLIGENWPRDLMKRLKKWHCISYHVDHQLLNEDRVATFKASGHRLLAWTVNDAKRAETLLSWGVDAVFSDHPQLLKGVSL